MKQRALLLILAITSVMMLVAPTLRAQVPFVIPIVVSDDSLNTRTLALGILATADPCVDTADNHGGYQEFELPPIPPTNVFDARFDDPSAVTNTPCFLQGSAVDYRPAIGPGQKDTFFVRIQQGTGLLPIHLSWPAGLNAFATSMVLQDAVSDGGLYSVDMLTTTGFDLVIPGAENFKIIMCPDIPLSGITFLTLTPDNVFDENPMKPGKSNKPSKRFKGFLPNWSNLLDETVVQGGFADSTSESDEAGGMVIGQSYMFLSDPVKKKYKPVKESAELYYWLRLSKFDQVKQLGKSSKDIQKSLKDKTGSHIGIARGLDSTLNPGDLKRKMLVKEKKKHLPKTQSNRLFAEFLALKVNIAASSMGKTPAGFGDLLYENVGHPFDGMSIIEISAVLDTQMTHWLVWGGNGGPLWDSAYSALYDINRAFPGLPTDTLSWEAGGPTAKLELDGTIDITSVSFLSLPAPFVPTRITPRNNLWEAPDDFEDDDFDDNETDGVPTAVKLYQNFPNPFNPSTTIAFQLRHESNVSIKVYNMLGQEVAILFENEDMDEGVQTVDFSASFLSSGVYFYRIEAQDLETDERVLPVVGKMMLLK